MKKFLTAVFVLAVGVVCLTLAGCGKTPSVFESKTYADVGGNRINGVMVAKEGDLWYRFDHGTRVGKGYLSLTSADDGYSATAFLENASLPIYDAFLATGQGGERLLVYQGEEYLLPEGATYSFSLPYLVGVKDTAGDDGDLCIFVSLNALTSDLSSVSKGEENRVVADFSTFVYAYELTGEGVYDYVILKDETGYVVYDAYGKAVFTDADSVGVVQKDGTLYYSVYHKDETYSVYNAEKECILDGYTAVYNQSGYDYLIAYKNGEAPTYTYYLQGKLLTLPVSTEVVAYLPDCIIYLGNDDNYYLFDGENHRLPYENIVTNSDASCFFCWEKMSDVTVDIYDDHFALLCENVTENTALSNLSEPEKGIFVFYDERDDEAHRTYHVFSDDTEQTLALSGEVLTDCEISGYYRIVSNGGNGANCYAFWNLYTGQRSQAYDYLSAHSQNGVVFGLGVSYSQGKIDVVELNGFSVVSTLTFDAEKRNGTEISVGFSQNVGVMDQGYYPLCVLTLRCDAESTCYAVMRKGVYRERGFDDPLTVCKLEGTPKFTATGGYLVTEKEDVRYVYRVGAEGISFLCSTQEPLTSSLVDGNTGETCFVTSKNGVYGVANVQGKSLISPSFDAVLSVYDGNFYLRSGERYAVARIGKKTVYPAETGLSSAEFFTNGYFVAVQGDGKADLYRENTLIESDLLSSEKYYDISKNGEGKYEICELGVFRFGTETKLLKGAKIDFTQIYLSEDSSYGDVPVGKTVCVHYRGAVRYEDDLITTGRLQYLLPTATNGSQRLIWYVDEAHTVRAVANSVINGKYGYDVTLYGRWEETE